MSLHHVRLTAHLTPEQRDALRALRARTCRPMSSFLREAVDRVLDRYDALKDPSKPAEVAGPQED